MPKKIPGDYGGWPPNKNPWCESNLMVYGVTTILRHTVSAAGKGLMTPDLAALISALCSAILAGLLRWRSPSQHFCWALTSVNSLGGALVLSCIWLTPDIWHSIYAVAPMDFAILVASGFLWTIAVFCDYSASVSLSQSLNALLRSLRLVTMVGGGWLFFKETLSYREVVGALLIVAGQIPTILTSRGQQSRGITIRLVSLATGTAALLIDKYLTIQMPWELVLVGGYFFPGCMVPMLRAHAMKQGLREVLSTSLFTLSTTALFILLGNALVWALAAGRVSTVLLLVESSTLCSFLIGIFIFRERDYMRQKLISLTLVVVGVICILL